MEEELSWISVEHELSVDDEMDFIYGSSSILLESEDGLELISKEIGSISFYIYNTTCFVDWDEFIEIADSISGDELFLIENFIESGKILFGMDKVLSLDTIKIKQEYREKGYGSLAMEDLIKFSRILGVDHIILKPAPIEGETFNEQRAIEIERIKRFYEKLDFEVFSPKKGGPGEPYMILSL